MRVVKRNGEFENVAFDKILRKNDSLTATKNNVIKDKDFLALMSKLSPLNEVDSTFVTQQTIAGIHDGVTTQELDIYSASVAQSLALNNPQYSVLAGRIMASNLHKNIECQLAMNFNVPDSEIRKNTFLYATRALWNNRNANNEHSPLVAPFYMAYVEKNIDYFNSIFRYYNDYNIDYMGYSILEGTYLFRSLLQSGTRHIVECPQHMFMRVAIGIECATPDPTGPVRDTIEQKIMDIVRSTPGLNDVNAINSMGAFLENVVTNDTKRDAQKIFESMMADTQFGILTDENKAHIRDTYVMMSEKLGTHATPTLFNAGTLTPQCSSCYLLPPPEDSMEGITNSWRSEAMISKWAGGIGSIVYSLRPQGSYIAGTNGKSNGIVPNLKVHNDIAVYVDQCFAAQTTVYTRDGPIDASDVAVGTSILTHDGTYHEVTAVREYDYNYENHNALMVINDVLVTDKHPILVYNKLSRKREYIPAGDLLARDHSLAFPIPMLEEATAENSDPQKYFSNGANGNYVEDFIYTITNIRSYLAGVFSKLSSVDDNIITVNCDAEIIQQIKFVLMHLGVYATGNPLKFSPTKETIELLPLLLYEQVTEISEDANVENYMSVPIYNRATTVDYVGKLYDFDVDTNENFVTGLGIAHNGGGKRPGSNAVYNTPWHGDIMEFLQLRKERGVESERARDLFYAMWLQDEFMRAVVAGKDWYLMCPNTCPGLYDVYDSVHRVDWLNDEDVNPEQFAFTSLYRKYIREGKYIRVVKAQDIFNAIMDLQVETGLPYMLYSDSINRKSNQKNIGTVKSSNLCVAPETTVLTRDGHVAIKKLAKDEKPVEIWNGREWSEVTVLQTGEFVPLLHITFSNGKSIDCTPQHKFYVLLRGKTEIVAAEELWSGYELIPYTNPDGATESGVRVKTVEDMARYDDTYCFKEPLRGMGVFNGILTGQCTEITEVSTRDETAVCNLASICLNNLVLGTGFDYNMLRSVVRTQVYNLNRIIDVNFYPTTNTRRSNLRNRPMGIGVQGLADLFVNLRMPFDSDDARELNFYIFEAIYYYALEMSTELAEIEGVYPSYVGSPTSEGILQFDAWVAENAREALGEITIAFPLRQDWPTLREKIRKSGLRNSLFVAPMPTASTAGIMGNSPCFEPFNSLIYKRRIKDGEFIIINKSLITDLLSAGLWNTYMRDAILQSGGSIQEITDIPKEIRSLYKTVWDMSQKTILIMALDRAVFVDQSQSMNLFISAPNTRSLSQVHLYGWRRGIKTGSYYIWGRAPIDAQKIQISKNVDKMLRKVDNKSPSKLDSKNNSVPEADGPVCTKAMRDAGCLSCGS